MRNLLLGALMMLMALPVAAQRDYVTDMRDIGGKLVTVTQPWTRANSDVGRNAPVYFKVHNTTDMEDAIVGATSPYAREVAVHQTRENALGVDVMQPVDGVTIPQGAKVALKPGGFHLMMIGLQQPLKLGMEVPVKVEFKNSRAQYLRVQILGPRSMGPDAAPTH